MNKFLWALTILAALVYSLSRLLWAFADFGQASAATLNAVANFIEAWERFKQLLNF